MEKSMEAVPVAGTTRVIEIDERHRQAYQMRRSGEAVGAIATKFGVDPRTINRWIKSYEESYRKALEDKPMVNLIAQELAKLDEMEETARQLAKASRSDAHCRGYLNLALKALVSKQQLLLDVGVLQKEPTKIYTTVSSHKQYDKNADSGDERSDEQVKEDLIQLLKSVKSL